MFSSMTMASSTTKPTDSVKAISERLSRLKPMAYMAAKVPTTDMGSVSEGMTVAEKFRRNKNMTITTRPSVSTRVNSTSWVDSLMLLDLSYMICMSTEAGSWERKVGSRRLTASETSTVLVPG